MLYSESVSVVAGVARAVYELDDASILDVCATEHFVAVSFDPSLRCRKDIEILMRNLATEQNSSKRPPAEFVIPMIPDGQDLLEVCAVLNVTESELLAQLTEHRFEVAHLGFAPGFIYLKGLEERFHLPRLKEPRASVPAGSIALGGKYLGIYGASTPGGWSLLGRTPAKLFDPNRDPPIDLVPGDFVQFEIGDSNFYAQQDLVDMPIKSGFNETYYPVLRVETITGMATFQDLGRCKSGFWAVPRAGAADPWSHRSANLLVGNDANSASLEIMTGELSLTALTNCYLAATGAPLNIYLDGNPVSCGHCLPIIRGTAITIRRYPSMMYSYLAIAGGFMTPRAFSSQSHDTLAGFGPSPLSGGEHLLANAAHGKPRDHILDLLPGIRSRVRVLAGPQFDLFSDNEINKFFASEFIVSPISSRIGIRLTNSSLGPKSDYELDESQPLALGAIQVTPSGEPIVMLADHPATGGYRVIAVTAQCDIDRVAQARPGEKLSFELISEEEALSAYSQRIAIEARLVVGYRPYDELRLFGF